MLDKSGSHLNESFPQKKHNLNGEKSNGFIHQNGTTKTFINLVLSVSYTDLNRIKIFLSHPKTMSADVLLCIQHNFML